MAIVKRKTFEQARLLLADEEGCMAAAVFGVSYMTSGCLVAGLQFPLIAGIALFAAMFTIGNETLCKRWWRPRHASKVKELDRWAESTATVIDTETSTYEDKHWVEHRAYYLIIRFSTPQSVSHLRARVYEPLCDRAQPGDTLAIRYNPGDPSVALLEGEPGFDEL